MSERQQMIPVWFFIGVILLIYGILIFATGAIEYSNPSDTVFSNLHPALWWGVILVVLGGVYVYRFCPRRK